MFLILIVPVLNIKYNTVLIVSMAENKALRRLYTIKNIKEISSYLNPIIYVVSITFLSRQRIRSPCVPSVLLISLKFYSILCPILKNAMHWAIYQNAFVLFIKLKGRIEA